MTKEGWLKFKDLLISENQIAAVSKKKNKLTIHLQSGQKFTLSKSESSDFWSKFTGENISGGIELTEIDSETADNFQS